MPSGTAVFLQNRELFGALLVHIPVLHALRRMPGGTPLVVYSPFAAGKLFESLGLAEETRVWTRAQGSSEIAAGLPALVKELRGRRYQRIVSLRPQSADVIAAIAASGARERIGYSKHFAHLVLTASAPHDTQIYRALDYLNLVGITEQPAVLAGSMAALAAQATGESSAAAGAYVFMPCGHQEPKLWGEENYVALAQTLVARDREARFLLVLGSAERRYVELFERADLGARTSALVGASVPEIARAVLAARVVVANDCGPSHIAQIAGVPIVSIFGNWDGKTRSRIAEWFHPRPGARCLTSAEPASIRTLGVELVLAEIDKLLADPRTTGGVVFARPARALSA